MIYLNADCMNPETGLPSFPDNYFDLAIVDPPYGIGRDGSAKTTSKHGGRKAHKFKGWDNETPNAAYFKELFRASRNQIVWGANYFCEFLPPSMGWIFWDKGQRICNSDGELAFTSFDRALRVAEYNRVELLIEGTMHPTQKPMALYRWLLKNYAKQCDLILDTHVGSASSLVVYEEMGFDYVGYELDPDYYRDSCKRIEAARAQPNLFTGKEIFEASKPPELF
jgi:site-specific DNA-methyltransferase (adenine-specific)